MVDGTDGEDISISRVDTVVVNAEMRNWIFVRVRTNVDGLYGWGEASLNWKTHAVIGAIEDLARLVTGRDAWDITRSVMAMKRNSYYRLGIVGASAISGIEQALWDLKAKALGVPVWQLLGGRVRDSVRVYGHLGLGDMRTVYGRLDRAKLGDAAHAVIERGYDAIKIVPVPYCGYVTSRAERRDCDETVGTVRDAIGPDVDLMLDFHGRPGSVGAALQFIDVVRPYEPMFVEEPVQPGDTEAMSAVTRAAGCSVAAGERLVGLGEFLPLLSAKAVHVAQPDLCHVGGLGEAVRIASVAEEEGIGIAPHNPNGPVASAVALHFAVSTPNFVIQEEMSGAVPWYDDVVESPIRREGSRWAVPSTPGFGIEIDETEAAKHPFRPEEIGSTAAVLSDGTVAHW